MDKTELAKLMIRYEELNAQLEEVGDQIAQEVIKLEETTIVGNVRATYNSGRRVFDWKSYAYTHNVDPEITHFNIKIDWRKACEDNGLDMEQAPVISQSDPSVTIKVKK